MESSTAEMPTHTTKDKAVTWAHGAQSASKRPHYGREFSSRESLDTLFSSFKHKF